MAVLTNLTPGQLTHKIMYQKGNIIVPLLAGALVVALAAAGFLFWQNQNYQGEALGPYTPPTTSSPTSVPNETASWKTFISESWNYSFSYPETYMVDGLNMGEPQENIDVEVFSPQKRQEMSFRGYPFLRVMVAFDSTTDLETFAKSSFEGNKDNNILTSSLNEFSTTHVTGWQYTFEGREFSTTNQDGQTAGESGFVVDYQSTLKVVFLQSANTIYTVILSDQSPFDQILSTFKFTSSTSDTEFLRAYPMLQGYSDNFNYKFGPEKIITTRIQKADYGPPFGPGLYDLVTDGNYLFAISKKFDLGNYVNMPVEVTYREVEGMLMTERQLVIVDKVTPL